MKANLIETEIETRWEKTHTWNGDKQFEKKKHSFPEN